MTQGESHVVVHREADILLPEAVLVLAAEDPFLVDIYLTHVMEQRTDSDAIQGELCLQLRFHADNLLSEHNGSLIDVHGVLRQAAFAGQMDTAGRGGLEEAEFFKLGDNIVDTFATGRREGFYEMVF